MKKFEILTFNDISKICKDSLIKMCEHFSLDEIGSVADLAQRLWTYYQAGNQKEFEAFNDMIFTPRGSISWFSVVEGTLDNVISNIKQETDNPFEKMLEVSSTLDTTPFLYAAAEEDDGYYLKYAFNKGNIFINDIDGRKSVPKREFGIVFINLDLNIIEIRSPFNNTSIIAKEISKAAGEDVVLERTDILLNHGDKVENFATSLNGSLVEVIDVPSLENKELEITNDIYDILACIDESIEKDEYTNLELKLKEMGELINTNFPDSSYTLLLLAGLSQIRLGTVQLENTSTADIRDTPLYTALKPYLKNTMGFIEMKENHDGVIEYYKIQVGVNSKTVSLGGNFTEEILSKIRQKI